MNKEQENNKQSWVNVEWDYEWSGTNCDWWDKHYGEGNWRLIWQLPNKELLDFDKLFSLFVDSYAKYFEDNPVDALFLTNHFAYVYGTTHIYKETAFSPHALYHKTGEFHHVAINLALTEALGLEFKGDEPLSGHEARFWRPSQIPPHPRLVPPHPLYPTLNDFYKTAQKLQIKK